MKPESSPRVELVSSSDQDLHALIDELSALLAERYGSSGRDGFDPAGEDPRTVFALARVDGAPVGCGAVRPLGPELPGVAEVKRMFARTGTSGVGRAVLAVLEAEAARRGWTVLWLETRRANDGAIAFYRRAGYVERAAYGKYVGRSEAICMEKLLTVDASGLNEERRVVEEGAGDRARAQHHGGLV